MEKLFIVFTHQSNWNIEGISNLIEGENPGEKVWIGFPNKENHFALIFFNKNKVLGQFFGAQNFPKLNKNSVLLIHNDEEINEWDDIKKEYLANFVNKYKEIFIYYHERDKNRHKKIEEIVSGKSNIFIAEGMHEKGYLYEQLELLNDCQSQGEFNKKLQELKKSFFNKTKESEEQRVIEEKITILHKLLVNEDLEGLKKMLKSNYNKEYNSSDENKMESLRKLRSVLMKN